MLIYGPLSSFYFPRAHKVSKATLERLESLVNL